MFSWDDKQEFEKMPLLAMPLPKPKTVIEFEFDVTHWDYYQIEAYIKKLCEEHERKRDLHIRFTGKPNAIDESITQGG